MNGQAEVNNPMNNINLISSKIIRLTTVVYSDPVFLHGGWYFNNNDPLCTTSEWEKANNFGFKRLIKSVVLCASIMFTL
jgi:hypothetical protein